MARFRSLCKRWSKAPQPASPTKFQRLPFIDNGQTFDPALCPLLSRKVGRQVSYRPKSTNLEVAPFLELEISQDEWAKSCEVREVDIRTGKEVTTRSTPSNSRRQRLQRRPAIKSLRQAYTTSTESNGSRRLSNVETPTPPRAKELKSRKPLSTKASSVKAQVRQSIAIIRQIFSEKKREEPEEEFFTERYALNLPEGVSKDKSELDYIRRIQKEGVEATRLAKVARQDTRTANTSFSTTATTAKTLAVSIFSGDITTEATSSSTTTATTNTPVGSLFSEDIITASTASDTTITCATTLSSAHDANKNSQFHPYHRTSLYPRQAADEWLLTQHDDQESHFPNPLQKRPPKATMADFHTYSTWRYGPRVPINQEEVQRREAARSSWQDKLDSHRVVVDHEEVEYMREAEDRYDNAVGHHPRPSLVGMFLEYAFGDAAYELEREEEREGRLGLGSLERLWAADALVAAMGE